MTALRFSIDPRDRMVDRLDGVFLRQPLWPEKQPRFRKVVWQWRQRRRSWTMLAQMDDYLLKDIGLTRGDAWQEAGKPFWRG